MRRAAAKFPKYSYRAIVSMEDTTDALDWCHEHRSRNSFYFDWEIGRYHDTPPNLILGEFYFSSSKDHMLFKMVWA